MVSGPDWGPALITGTGRGQFGVLSDGGSGHGFAGLSSQ